MTKLKNSYLADLKHSNIKKSNSINIAFEKEIANTILKSLALTNEILFAGFVNQDFDFVAVERTDTKHITVYFAPFADLNLLHITRLHLYDSGDKFKSYYKIELDSLPTKLQTLVRQHNSYTTKKYLIAHRFITSLVCNISGLEVHHLYLSRFNPAGKLERLEQSINSADLLPVTPEYHRRLHNLAQDLNEFEQKEYIAEMYTLKTVLHYYIFGSDNSKIVHRSDPELIKELLQKSKTNSILNLSVKYKAILSYSTIHKICTYYTHLKKWV